MPSVSFFPGLFGHKSDSSLSDHLAGVQGLVCPEGCRGSRGHFHSREERAREGRDFREKVGGKREKKRERKEGASKPRL